MSYKFKLEAYRRGTEYPDYSIWLDNFSIYYISPTYKKIGYNFDNCHWWENFSLGLKVVNHFSHLGTFPAWYPLLKDYLKS